MFGIDSTILAFIALAGFSAGAVAYAFLFNTIATEKNAGKRLETVKRADTDRSVVKASRDRIAEAAKRRKSVQDSLKDLDAKQKAKDQNVKKPPLKVQLRQAGLTTTVERFYLYSLVCGLVADDCGLRARRAPAGRGRRVRSRARSACRAGSSRSSARAASRRSWTSFPTRSTSSCARSSPVFRSMTASG